MFSNFRRSSSSVTASTDLTTPAPSFISKTTLPPTYNSQIPSAQQLPEARHHQRESMSLGTDIDPDGGQLPELGSAMPDPSLYTVQPGYPNACVYYRIFTADGAISSKRPANDQNPWLGCIEAVHITPPQTVASIIRCMCKVEQITRFHFAKLYLFDATAIQMDEKEALAILSGAGPGSDITRPLALVLGPTSEVFTTPIIAKHGIYLWSSEWLNYKKKEILYTDGIVRTEKCRTIGGTYMLDAYRAQNSKGRIGFVLVQNFAEIS